MQKIGIAGFGRLGGMFGLLCESYGIGIMAIDKNKTYLEQLAFKSFKSSEPLFEDLLKESRLIEYSTRIEDALNYSDILFVFVATPSREDNSYDTKYIEQVVMEIYECHDRGVDTNGKTLVVSSTVMPTYTKTLNERLLNIGINVIYCPTMIAQGSIASDLHNADIILVGTDRELPQAFYDVFNTITAKPNYKIMSHTGAEITKIATNCFLSLKIGYSGMIGDVCLESGLSETERDTVLEAVGSDKRVGNYFFKYGFPASGICVVPTQELITKRGVIEIQDIKIGDFVLSHDGKFNKVTEIFTRQYRGEMCKFKLEGFSTDELIITPEHPIWSAVRNANRRYELFNPKKLKPLTPQQHDNLKIEFVEAGKLEHGDMFAMPQLKTESNTPQYIELQALHKSPHRFIELTPDAMRLLGYFFAEGNTDNESERIQFSFSDTEILFHKDVMELLQNCFALKSTLRIIPERKGGIIRAYSPQLVEYFNRVFLKGCQNLKVPYEWLELSDEHLIHFLRGFWYGDGSNSTGIFSCATISQEIFTFNKLVLYKLKIPFISVMREAIKTKDGVSHKKVYIIKIAKREGIERFNEIIPIKGIDMSTCKRGEKNTAFWKEDNYLYHIKKKEIIQYEGTVYNIEVENANSYMLTSSLVHNCIPRDTRALNLVLRRMKIDTALIEGLHDSNDSHMQFMSLQMRKKYPKDTVLEFDQLSYKKGVPILTESKHLEMCIMLLRDGYKIHISESEEVINQAKPLLEDWKNQITYTIKN